jgi:hypothetical protein
LGSEGRSVGRAREGDRAAWRRADRRDLESAGARSVKGLGNDLRLDPPRTAGLSVRHTGIAIAEGHLDHDGRERVGSPGGAGGG